MKKTLIALAVAASAVSGSAIAAWNASGTNVSVELLGSLKPKAENIPWEIKGGSEVNTLNTTIKKGKSMVDVVVDKPILVLGIRNKDNILFLGRAGITPKIDYNGAVDLNGFSESVTKLTLDVKNAANKKIGTMTVDFIAGAGVSRASVWRDGNKPFDAFSVWGRKAFAGGLSNKSAGVTTDLDALLSRIGTLDSFFFGGFNKQGAKVVSSAWELDNFSLNDVLYSAFYGSGIEKGKTIKITFDQPVTDNGNFAWKAELPVTVSYK